VSAWKWTTGKGRARVTAIEQPTRGSMVYLRWREKGNWQHRSLKESCRTSSGRLIQAVCDRAIAAAREESEASALA
jgi:hypothetical protein